jgi:hypothetical protein
MEIAMLRMLLIGVLPSGTLAVHEFEVRGQLEGVLPCQRLPKAGQGEAAAALFCLDAAIVVRMPLASSRFLNSRVRFRRRIFRLRLRRNPALSPFLSDTLPHTYSLCPDAGGG